jgi:hypothetical protein
MRYKQGAASPLHLHENCEHFYFIMEGRAASSAGGIRDVNPGDMVFILRRRIACAPQIAAILSRISGAQPPTTILVYRKT